MTKKLAECLVVYSNQNGSSQKSYTHDIVVLLTQQCGNVVSRLREKNRDVEDAIKKFTLKLITESVQCVLSRKPSNDGVNGILYLTDK